MSLVKDKLHWLTVSEVDGCLHNISLFSKSNLDLDEKLSSISIDQDILKTHKF